MLIKKSQIYIYTNPHTAVISYVAKNGKVLENSLYRLRYFNIDQLPPEIIINLEKKKVYRKITGDFCTFSIISPKKIIKHSVDRNYARRRLYSEFQTLPQSLISGKIFVAIVKQHIKCDSKLEIAELSARIKPKQPEKS